MKTFKFTYEEISIYSTLIEAETFEEAKEIVTSRDTEFDFDGDYVGNRLCYIGYDEDEDECEELVEW